MCSLEYSVWQWTCLHSGQPGAIRRPTSHGGGQAELDSSLSPPAPRPRQVPGIPEFKKSSQFLLPETTFPRAVGKGDTHVLKCTQIFHQNLILGFLGNNCRRVLCSWGGGPVG